MAKIQLWWSRILSVEGVGRLFSDLGFYVTTISKMFDRQRHVLARGLQDTLILSDIIVTVLSLNLQRKQPKSNNNGSVWIQSCLVDGGQLSLRPHSPAQLPTTILRGKEARYNGKRVCLISAPHSTHASPL